MLEGMQVELTKVGSNWTEWFEVGGIVTISRVEEDDMLIVNGNLGAYLSNLNEDCQGKLITKLTAEEVEVIKMLYPWVEQCLNLAE